jgi:hypothetical protein
MGAAAYWLLEAAAHELLLFAAVGLLIGGIDDLIVDAIWIGRGLVRRVARYPRVDVAKLAPPLAPGPIAVLIGAWDESAVIGAMLRHALATFDHGDYRLYVGAYPNDPATIAAVEAVAREDARVRLVVGMRDGPTTKADCLNRIWHALVADEAAGIMYQMHQGDGRGNRRGSVMSSYERRIPTHAHWPAAQARRTNFRGRGATGTARREARRTGSHRRHHTGVQARHRPDGPARASSAAA